jgi:hypothetical protein
MRGQLAGIQRGAHLRDGSFDYVKRWRWLFVLSVQQKRQSGASKKYCEQSLADHDDLR